MAVVEILVEDGVGIVTINRPDALNAVNHEIMVVLLDAVAKFDGV